MGRIKGKQIEDVTIPDAKLVSPVHRGTATLNFGSTPTNNASVSVTGQSGIASSSVVSACMMYEATADHSADEHAMAPIRLTCGSIVAGTGFTVMGVSDWLLTGTFKVRWSWV